MNKSIKPKSDYYFDNISVHKDIAIGYFSSNITLSNEFTIPNLNGYKITGKKLYGKDGKIFIGKNVKKVRVNASIFYENINIANTAYVWAFIEKNGVRYANAITSGVSHHYQTANISDTVIDVKEGDCIYFVFNWAKNSNSAPIIRAGDPETRLYVEVVE